jgi:hypothetical protein
MKNFERLEELKVNDKKRFLGDLSLNPTFFNKVLKKTQNKSGGELNFKLKLIL